jgi:hypothetical protein
LDVSASEQKINATAERLAEEAEAANARARREAEMIAGYHGKRRRENRLAWIDYHRRQTALFERLAREHRQAAGRLIDG